MYIVGESFQLQMGFRFHSYMLTIYICLYWLWELVVFYSLVRRRYIRKVSEQLLPKHFHVIAVLIVFHAANENKPDEKNISDSKVAPLSLSCRTDIAPLSLRCCCSFCRYAVTPVIASAIAPLSLWCRSGVTPLLFPYQSAIAPLLLRCRCCHWCCRSSYRSCCHSTDVAWIFNGRRLKGQNQGNGFHRWLSGACVFLLRGVFDFLWNSQGGSLLT